MRILLAALLVYCATASAAPPAAQTTPVSFRIDEGRNLNLFVRDGPVAAHLLLRTGTEPRVLVAFPAGNSGVGLWFQQTDQPVAWKLIGTPKPVTAVDARKRPLYGIEFEAETDAHELRPRGAILSSIRVLRDYELQGKALEEIGTTPRVSGGSITWARDRLDGAAGFVLTIEAASDASITPERFTATGGAPLRLRIRALCGETPLHPLDALLTPRAGNDPRARDALAFLSYQEKFLAGSWRFDTYFGRDTMISALLLAPVLEPPAIESAIASVLDRLAPDGEAAHEEDIGEFAVLRNAREGRGKIPTPIYDYGMVDDDFMLAPLAARWLLDDPRSRAHAREFLSARGAHGETHGDALARNLTWVVERAAPFAADPRATNLVGIKPGRMTGQWRDSEQGLGRGRFAYDVNAAWVPASLSAAARLASAGLLANYLDAGERRTLAQAGDRARIWSARAPALFAVEIPADQARERIARYAKEIGVAVEMAPLESGATPLSFNALSLDEQGRPVPILNSDEGFRLLLTHPSADQLEKSIATIMRPFPAGLVTDVGVVVANPVFAGADLRREFSRFAYHGTVVWSWQQALLAAGLARQLSRGDLPAPVRARLEQARKQLWTVIERGSSLRTSELWSWSYSDGHYQMEPFGRPGADADESNAAQLWSTVYLGLTPAARD
jgi:hypothetical protein